MRARKIVWQHGWRGVFPHCYLRISKRYSGGLLFSLNWKLATDSDIFAVNHLRTEGTNRRLPHNKSFLVHDHRRLFLRLGKRESSDGPKHLIVPFMACFEYPSRLRRCPFTKSGMFTRSCAAAPKRGADSSQKLVTMQDATGAIGISYQMYLVEIGRFRRLSLMRRDSERRRTEQNYPIVALVPIR